MRKGNLSILLWKNTESMKKNRCFQKVVSEDNDSNVFNSLPDSIAAFQEKDLNLYSTFQHEF